MCVSRRMRVNRHRTAPGEFLCRRNFKAGLRSETNGTTARSAGFIGADLLPYA
jgi:hypothetical protein